MMGSICRFFSLGFLFLSTVIGPFKVSHWGSVKGIYVSLDNPLGFQIISYLDF